MPRSLEFAPGRQLTMHGDGSDGIALLWHGRGPEESYALQPLAEAVARVGVRVLAADWDSTADDFGRSDLQASWDFARRTAEGIGIDPERLVLVGWSLGGTAALGLALQSSRPLRTVLVAPGYADRAIDAFSERPLPRTFPPGQGQSTDILWGNRDELVDGAMAIGLSDRLRDAGWTVTTTELDADHSGVVGVRWDDATEGYVDDRTARGAMAKVATAIAAASRLP